MMRLRFLVILVLLFCSAAAAQTDLASRIDKLLADPALAHGTQGVVVESLSTGKVLYARNRDTTFIPASNFKLIVAATALDKLGPDFQFSTRLFKTGKLDRNGRLYGDLILVGGGDPLLTSPDLMSMAWTSISLRMHDDIHRVMGSVVADDTRFDDIRLGSGWAWDNEPYYYSAEISALNVDENVVAVWVYHGAKVGAPVSIRWSLDTGQAYYGVDPRSFDITLRGTAVTGAAKSENTLSVDRVRGTNVIRVTGSIPVDDKAYAPTEKITVKEPARFAASIVRDTLVQYGIKMSGGIRKGKKPDGAVLLFEHRSAPLSVILGKFLKPSDNLIGEVLLKTLGAELKGQGTSAAGASVEMEFLKSIGADTGAISIEDGSGLSRRDYVTPGNLIAVLKYMWSHKDSKVFIDALPIAGVDGTLARRMKNTPAARNVCAKTGYVNHVSALSGYVKTKSGEPLVFSIMMNGHLCPNTDATRVQDGICELLAGEP